MTQANSAGVSIDIPVQEKKKSVSQVKSVKLNPVDMGLASNHKFLGHRYKAPSPPKDLQKERGDDQVQQNELEETRDAPHIIEPPYNLYALEDLPKDSATQQAAIDCLAVNIDGFGHEFKPTLDLDEKTVEVDGEKQKILVYRKTGDPVPLKVLQSMMDQKEFIEEFFEYFFDNKTFRQGRMHMRRSKKVFGFAGWEVLRNPFTKKPVGGNIIEDTKSIRMCYKDKEFTPYTQYRIVGNKIKKVKRRKRFRRYAQVLTKTMVGSKTRYYKEFGDPREMDANTGKYIVDKKYPENYIPATELYLFKRDDTESEYGIPEILAALLDVLGVRAAKEVNYNLLKNNTIPPMAVLIQGYDDPTIEQKIQDQMQEQIKGEHSRTSALIIQVDGQPVGVGINQDVIVPKIEIVPLAEILTQEGMFLKFIDESEYNIASVYRLPPLMLGKMQNTLNRATAETAKALAEEQVFSPERVDFDSEINRNFLPELGITYWRYCSLAAKIDNTKTILEILEQGRKNGAITINESRSILSTILPNEPLEQLKGDWADKPMEIVRLESNTEQPPEEEPMKEMDYDSQVIKALEEGVQKRFGQEYKIKKVYTKTFNHAA